MKIRLDIAYFGASFSGWQRQPDRATVQGELEKALELIFLKKIEVVGAGRTDAGVHAFQQVAHAQLPADFDLGKLTHALNGLTPPEIRLAKIIPASEDFHARFNPHIKTYRYRLDLNRYPNPFWLGTHAPVVRKTDLEKIELFLPQLIGTFDFASFTTSENATPTTVRTLLNAYAKRHETDELSLYFEGKGFLHNMVRILSGTALAIGEGSLNMEDVLAELHHPTHQGRKYLGRTLPAHGLCLQEIKYL